MTTTIDSAAPFVPYSRDIEDLRIAAKSCLGCPLWTTATQTVFGEGPADAKIMLIGEQPGDQEDRQGRPFVGPAGRLLDQALRELGIERTEIYVTNAVKHFKWTPSGPRRLHAKPGRREIIACRPWLDAEIEALKPDRIGLLGATAAQSLLGAGFKVTESRGQVLTDTGFARIVVATIHPSAILRMELPSEREAAYRAMVNDLKVLFRSSLRRTTAAA
jgi:uracil-DNA glycosylase family protein